MGADTGPRATWVWERPGVRDLLESARSFGVGDLFVSTPGDLATSADLRWFRDLRAASAAAGVRVQALGAEVAWLDAPSGALSWQRQALATGLFDGIHLDVEPWQHGQWGREPARLLSAWIDLLGRLTRDTDLPVEADVPFWLHEHRVAGRRVDEAVVSTVDAVTVLSYRDAPTGPDSITGVAATALATAERVGRPVRLAVETRFLGSDPDASKQTFHGASRRDLARALALVDQVLEGQRTWAGIAVHDHRGWQEMAL